MAAGITLVLLLTGFALLLKGADLLIEGSSSLASKLHVTEGTIGLTVVAFGTSMPEWVVNGIASLEHHSEIVFGNVIGSNIANLLLILGISGLMKPIQTEKNTVWKEIPFALLAAVVLWVLVKDSLFGGPENILTRNDGLILILFFMVFMVYTFGIARVETQDSPDVNPRSGWSIFGFILAGLAALFVGGKLVLTHVLKLGAIVGLSEEFLALTVVSVGTSLPELFTAVMAMKKKKAELAIGNVIGSNIFNTFFIMGFSATLVPQPFSGSQDVDLVFLIVISLFLFIAMFTGGKRVLDRWEAGLFLFLYAGYLVFLTMRG